MQLIEVEKDTFLYLYNFSTNLKTPCFILLSDLRNEVLQINPGFKEPVTMFLIYSYLMPHKMRFLDEI